MSESSRYVYLEPSRIARLGNMSLVARQVVEGFISGLHRSPHRGFSVEFAEHREYSPGDSLRHLDWQALGRTDRLFIKQYEEETNLRAHLLLDCSASMGYGTAGVTKFQYGCFLCACLSYLMLRQQDSVGLVAFDEDIRHTIPPGSTTAHFNILMRTLEGLQPGRTTNVAEQFHRLAERIRRRALLIVISDLFDDEQKVLQALGHFRHKKHEVILFHLFDPQERRLGFDRLLDFEDMETGDRLQVDARQVRNEYTRLVEEFIAFYTRAASERRIDYLVTQTDTPYDRVLAEFLGRRMVVPR